MRARNEPDQLLIHKVSRPAWALGALLAIGGGLCALGLAGLMGKDVPFLPPLGLEAELLGGGALAVGAWLCGRSLRASLTVELATRTVILTRQGLIRKSVEQYPATAISDVRVTKERDDAGTPVYRVELVLQTGDVVPVSLFHPHDREGCMRVAEQLWTALDLPRT